MSNFVLPHKIQRDVSKRSYQFKFIGITYARYRDREVAEVALEDIDLEIAKLVDNQSCVVQTRKTFEIEPYCNNPFVLSLLRNCTYVLAESSKTVGALRRRKGELEQSR